MNRWLAPFGVVMIDLRTFPARIRPCERAKSRMDDLKASSSRYILVLEAEQVIRRNLRGPTGSNKGVLRKNIRIDSW